ncbi:MAG: hypothetical protein KJ990_11650 [Proteobacteria bacterium]|nr:hypothetical protein [Pseudomonadota bacterium]MBU1647910.1 hypothetical protein [Pseudomonadota bacterium]
MDFWGKSLSVCHYRQVNINNVDHRDIDLCPAYHGLGSYPVSCPAF